VKTQYAYDGEGNPATTTRTFNFGGLINLTRVETATYGPGGRVVQQTYADNKIGETTVTSATYAYDDRAKPHALQWTSPGAAARTVATQTRNVAGLVTARVAPLIGTPGTPTAPPLMWRQFRTTFAHDKLTRVVSQTVVSASDTAMTTGVTHGAQTLDYYGMDDPATLQHAMGGTTYAFTFGYDLQHQLITVGETGGRYHATFAYGADLGGGLSSGSGKLRSAKVCVAPSCTTMSGGQVIPRDVSYQYNGASTTIDPEAPTGLANAGGGTLASYTYEGTGTGNLATSTRAGVTATFVYDGEDQLRRSVQSGSATGTEEYYYDHNGQRVGVVTRDGNGALTGTRIFAGDTEIEFTAGGAVSQAYAYLSMGTPVAKVVSPPGGWATTGAATWANSDSVLELQYHGLSSNTLLSITPSATIKAGFVYAPYGDVIQTTGASTSSQHRRFNDKFQDDLTSLSYYGVRYYDGVQLGWTQADPMYRFAPDAAWTEPRRANLYQFVLGNPIRYIDPDGRDGLGSYLWNALVDDNPVHPLNKNARDIISHTVSAVKGEEGGGDLLKGIGLAITRQASKAAPNPWVRLVAGVVATAAEGGTISLEEVVSSGPGGSPGGGAGGRGGGSGNGGGPAPKNILGGVGYVGKIPKPPTGNGAVPKSQRDPQRYFSEKQRAAKREEQGNECATGCGTDIKGGTNPSAHLS
jgi:RHS repeat-associated protein